MAERPTPPTPPVAPDLPDVDASPSRRARYRADKTKYEARLRMYEIEKKRFDRAMDAYLAAIARGEPDTTPVPQLKSMLAPEPISDDALLDEGVMPDEEVEAAADSAAPPAVAPRAQELAAPIPDETAKMLQALQEQLAAQQRKIDEMTTTKEQTPQPPPQESAEDDLPRFLGGRGAAQPQSQSDANAEQIRYETAMQALNGGAWAQSLLVDEAESRAVTVEALAKSIVEERQKREIAVAKAFAEQARASGG